MPATPPASPEVASARGRLAVLSRDHGKDHPDVIAAKRHLRELNAAQYIRRVVAEAPPLTSEQRDRLAELLRPTRTGVFDAAAKE